MDLQQILPRTVSSDGLLSLTSIPQGSWTGVEPSDPRLSCLALTWVEYTPGTDVMFDISSVWERKVWTLIWLRAHVGQRDNEDCCEAKESLRRMMKRSM
ncbi:hypothetical protein GJ744_006364 [Endocarpon pusillum]|uniref:Uncharacterized protein n=1 Tax=Endocarpon pusillum TaxID=364733 RepID=A0A8H7AJZ1_9EURO|nr:hypothetical protein GJ744_006364 [Endocarpon pusillum]